MSALRIAGVLVALLLGFMMLRNLSRRAPVASDGLGFLAALLLALVALFPGLVNLPAQAMMLGRAPGSRLIALLLGSSILLWLYTFWAAGQRRRKDERSDARLEALVAHIAAQGVAGDIDGVAVVLPAYNEEEAVGTVVRGLPQEILGLPVRALVVSDGSRDQTAAVARAAGALVLDLPINMGGGAAIRVGYNFAARSGARIIVTMDADGQHLASDIERLVEPIVHGETDFVIGSRRLGSFERVSGLRSAGLTFFNFFLNLLLQTHLTDCSSGFRAFDARKLPHLETTESQYHTSETIMHVRRLGLRIAERPIVVQRRIAGQSKKGTDIVYGYRFARTMLTRWLRG